MIEIFDLSEMEHLFKDKQAMTQFLNKLYEKRRSGPCLLTHKTSVYGLLTEELQLTLG